MAEAVLFLCACRRTAEAIHFSSMIRMMTVPSHSRKSRVIFTPCLHRRPRSIALSIPRTACPQAGRSSLNPSAKTIVQVHQAVVVNVFRDDIELGSPVVYRLASLFQSASIATVEAMALFPVHLHQHPVVEVAPSAREDHRLHQYLRLELATGSIAPEWRLSLYVCSDKTLSPRRYFGLTVARISCNLSNSAGLTKW